MRTVWPSSPATCPAARRALAIGLSACNTAGQARSTEPTSPAAGGATAGSAGASDRWRLALRCGGRRGGPFGARATGVGTGAEGGPAARRRGRGCVGRWRGRRSWPLLAWAAQLWRLVLAWRLAWRGVGWAAVVSGAGVDGAAAATGAGACADAVGRAGVAATCAGGAPAVGAAPEANARSSFSIRTARAPAPVSVAGRVSFTRATSSSTRGIGRVAHLDQDRAQRLHRPHRRRRAQPLGEVRRPRPPGGREDRRARAPSATGSSRAGGRAATRSASAGRGPGGSPRRPPPGRGRGRSRSVTRRTRRAGPPAGVAPPAATTSSSAEIVSRAEPPPWRTMASMASGSTSSPASPISQRTCSSSTSLGNRWNSRCWVRERIVSLTFCGSVVASTNTTCGGGSSSVFSKAASAALESMWTSSRMYTL